MKELGERLMNSGLGIKIGNILIPCLLFADDILLFASNQKEAEELLNIVIEFIKERHLTLNEDKTKIIGKGTKFTKHPIINEDSWEGHLKYLGLHIGEGNMWKMQREIMEKTMINKRNAMHAIAEQTLENVDITNLIWNGEVLPAVLYGCEVITMTRTLLKTLNTQQGETLRRLFKAHKSTNRAILRQEMGWQSVEGIIYKRKLNFWVYLCKLPNERWARQAFLESRKQKTSWDKEMKEIKDKIGIGHEILKLSINGAKHLINKRVNEWETRQNEEAINRCTSLTHYTCTILGKRKDYINNLYWIEVNKFITGQVILNSKSLKIDKCPLCGDEVELNTEHLLTSCRHLNNIQYPFILSVRAKYLHDEENIIRRYRVIDEIVNTPSVCNREELAKLWNELNLKKLKTEQYKIVKNYGMKIVLRKLNN